MNRYKQLFFLFTFVSLVSSVSYAHHAYVRTFPAPFIQNACAKRHFEIQIGAYRGTQGAQQHINIPTLIGDQFSVNKEHDYNALFGLGYYVDSQTFFIPLSLGINLFYLPEVKVRGDITQESLFTNLSYQYYVSNLPIFLIAKAPFCLSSHYGLTLDAGLGPNFMFLTRFSEQAINPATLPDTPFSNTTEVNLAATVGINLRINGAACLPPLEMGYRFFYLGRGSFDHNQQVSSSLRTGNVYANAITCTVLF